MPLFHLKTNVPQSQISEKILKSLSATLAETSTKPESFCQVCVEPGLPMTFGGTTEPTAFAEYICIGVIGGKVNEAITAKFAAILATLGVSKDRFYIKFVDAKPSDIGLSGTTCQVLFYS